MAKAVTSAVVLIVKELELNVHIFLITLWALKSPLFIFKGGLTMGTVTGTSLAAVVFMLVVGKSLL